MQCHTLRYVTLRYITIHHITSHHITYIPYTHIRIYIYNDILIGTGSRTFQDTFWGKTGASEPGRPTMSFGVDGGMARGLILPQGWVVSLGQHEVSTMGFWWILMDFGVPYFQANSVAVAWNVVQWLRPRSGKNQTGVAKHGSMAKNVVRREDVSQSHRLPLGNNH